MCSLAVVPQGVKERYSYKSVVQINFMDTFFAPDTPVSPSRTRPDTLCFGAPATALPAAAGFQRLVVFVLRGLVVLCISCGMQCLVWQLDDNIL